MYCQMIRVISSPSISTTGLATLIFAMAIRTFAARNGWENGRDDARLRKSAPTARRRRYSIRAAAEKGANAQVSAAFLAAFGYTRWRRSNARGRNRQHQGLGHNGGSDHRPGRAAARREYRRRRT